MDSTNTHGSSTVRRNRPSSGRHSQIVRAAIIAAGLMVASASVAGGCRLAATPLPDPIGDRAHIRDASGLSWLAGDTFLVAHDAKFPDETANDRIGLLILPDSSERVAYAALQPAWPERSGPSSDLESIGRIPGSWTFLLAESGDDGSIRQRMFLSEMSGGELFIRDVVDWPAPIYNVEGMAVAKIGGHLVFLYAERAHGRTSVSVRWTTMTMNPVAFGEFESVSFETGLPADPNLRPISSIEVDPDGRMYASSAYDPDVETGPFRSIVWEIGRLQADAEGQPTVRLLPRPMRVATLDGLKVESLAARTERDGLVRLYVGTDDEGFGGIVRTLP